MLRKQSDILIFDRDTKELKFRFPIVTSFEMESARTTYTDTATLTFPNRLRRKENLIDKINIGDKIVVNLGYFLLNSLNTSVFCYEIEPFCGYLNV